MLITSALLIIIRVLLKRNNLLKETGTLAKNKLLIGIVTIVIIAITISFFIKIDETQQNTNMNIHSAGIMLALDN